MRHKDVKLLNVDDFIRERKRKGVRFIRWSKESYPHFEEFLRAVCAPIPGVSMGFGFDVKELLRLNPVRFMGVDHYIPR